MSRKQCCWLPLMILASTLAQAAAWGRDGHATIADIAQDFLTPATRKAVLKLLGKDGNMSDCANWADEMTHDPLFQWSAPLHFTNVRDPSSACQDDKKKCTFQYTRDCVDRDGNNPGFCNAGAILNYTKRLVAGLAAGKSDTATRDALKFVIHFVGDIHQPLHCGLLEDRGGVQINVIFPVNGQGSDWNLHNVWDFGLIVNKEGLEGHRFRLIKSITSQIGSTWAKDAAAWKNNTDPKSWVQESLDAATQYAYRFANGTVIRQTTSRADHIVIGNAVDSYMSTGGIVERQLATAAVRLATLLNGVFSSWA